MRHRTSCQQEKDEKLKLLDFDRVLPIQYLEYHKSARQSHKIDCVDHDLQTVDEQGTFCCQIFFIHELFLFEKTPGVDANDAS